MNNCALDLFFVLGAPIKFINCILDPNELPFDVSGCGGERGVRRSLRVRLSVANRRRVRVGRTGDGAPGVKKNRCAHI